MPFFLRLTLFFLAFSLWALGQEQTSRRIAQSSFPSVVLLVMEDAIRQPISIGSGFFVRGGVIATNSHVIEGASSGFAKLVGQRVKYEIKGIVGLDKDRDLALLSVTGAPAPALQLGESNKVQVGDEVYAVGNPEGLEGTFSKGIISAIRQVNSETLLQLTAPISPGSSGGPVLDTDGKVVGVAVATFRSGQNLNFAIPSSYLTELLLQIKPLSPLSPTIRSGTTKSITDAMGEQGKEGVIGENLIWDTTYSNTGYFSFTIRNQLREPVRKVYCLIIFYSNLNPA